MVIDKKDREELKNLLEEILSNSATYKHIDGLNPSRIYFDGVEYYIYIKNLSPAQLSNNNPDIWRIQLPIRDIFEIIKESPVPFILLGYDAYNDVYATWNPHWAKQRLNVAKSVSFYSRLSVQENAHTTGQIQRFELQLKPAYGKLKNQLYDLNVIESEHYDDEGNLQLVVAMAPQKLEQLINQAHLPLVEILGNKAEQFKRPLEEFEIKR